jgi:hypothetical protein
LLLCSFWRAIEIYGPGTGNSITGNTIVNPAGFNPDYLFDDPNYIAVTVTDAATIANENRALILQNNRISGVTVGISILLEGAPNSANGLDITNNLIEAPFQDQSATTPTGRYMVLENGALSLFAAANWCVQVSKQSIQHMSMPGSVCNKLRHLASSTGCAE